MIPWWTDLSRLSLLTFRINERKRHRIVRRGGTVLPGASTLATTHLPRCWASPWAQLPQPQPISLGSREYFEALHTGAKDLLQSSNVAKPLDPGPWSAGSMPLPGFLGSKCPNCDQEVNQRGLRYFLGPSHRVSHSLVGREHKIVWASQRSTTTSGIKKVDSIFDCRYT